MNRLAFATDGFGVRLTPLTILTDGFLYHSSSNPFNPRTHGDAGWAQSTHGAAEWGTRSDGSASWQPRSPADESWNVRTRPPTTWSER